MGYIVKIASINQSLYSSCFTHFTTTKLTIICGYNGPPRLIPLDTKVIQWNIFKDRICIW